ncbi:atp-binding cassette transporter subfamily a abca [Anaeramoeba flamelloides]|uniref:Atp-binding cassette transporter subfamily a abca n=1 Tax=Anaeramoeba flamelloides TaxID=1746091 RepID=A0AAV8AEP3_9EUKA|nr:atp-binding cassette transporter subfamily a abca [Anaeramoeba flamelloides]
MKSSNSTEHLNNRLLPSVKNQLEFGSQFSALFRKSYLLQKRRKKTNLCQICVALAVVLIIFSFQLLINHYLNFNTKPTTDPQKFKYGFLTDSEVPYLDLSDGLKFNKFLKTVSEGYAYEAERYKISDKVKEIQYSAMYFEEQKSKDDIDDLLFKSFTGKGEGSELNGAMIFKTIEFGNSTNLVKPNFEFSIYYNQTGYPYVPGESLRTTRKGATLFLPSFVNAFFRSSYTHMCKSEKGANASCNNMRIGLKKFPEPVQHFSFDLISVAQPFFYQFLFHFMLPVFVIGIIVEKENKLIAIQRMMGLNIKVYWLVNFIFCYTIYLLMVTVFYIIGYSLKFDFFWKNNFLTHFLLFILWGFNLVGMGFLISTWFKRIKTATIFGYVIILLLIFGSSMLYSNIIGDGGKDDSTYISLQLIPSCAFYHGLQLLSDFSGPSMPGMKLSDVSIQILSIGSVYLTLFIEAIVIFLLFAYFYNVLPNNFSARKNPLFCFRYSFWKNQLKKNKKTKFKDLEHIDYNFKDSLLNNEALSQSSSNNSQAEIDINSAINSDDVHNLLEPKNDLFKEMEVLPVDIRKEILRVQSKDDPIAIKSLTKIYQGKDGNLNTTALNKLWLGIKKGECFGLLGPNGAGKTTLISILSGLTESTDGSAKICGFDVKTELKKIQANMGICAQEDRLWDDLTGKETLEFYARMHGKKKLNLKLLVEKTLEDFGLLDAKNKKIKEYSGGMKRRISVACALIFNPRIIFLDEPTTGLDPKSKRQIWTIISNIKLYGGGRSIILTTHSMEEAEALSDRIGILSNGILKTIGSSEELKSRYGKYFKFSMSVKGGIDREENAVNFIKSSFPNCEIINQISGNYNFKIAKQDVILSKLFQEMHERKDKFGITDWGISQTSLEEVFLHITQGNQSQNDEF